jgi:hypothetical protein
VQPWSSALSLATFSSSRRHSGSSGIYATYSVAGGLGPCFSKGFGVNQPLPFPFTDGLAIRPTWLMSLASILSLVRSGASRII